MDPEKDATEQQAHYQVKLSKRDPGEMDIYEPVDVIDCKYFSQAMKEADKAAKLGYYSSIFDAVNQEYVEVIKPFEPPYDWRDEL